ncbi:hypothetical protein PYCCODRAFT_1149907 [Trametes coccinea BRFM310]|uniref:Uncharacterized protein n=1 Tax=Trametes coccinea (strain BRFM310) TaxID=1353009 RepID=A0A1Y2I812_TRAC3|nr:hypothetical protein PYCCODRAFT_1149907 [Trametes coccinea BRFM310]
MHCVEPESRLLSARAEPASWRHRGLYAYYAYAAEDSSLVGAASAWTSDRAPWRLCCTLASVPRMSSASLSSELRSSRASPRARAQLCAHSKLRNGGHMRTLQVPPRSDDDDDDAAATTSLAGSILSRNIHACYERAETRTLSSLSRSSSHSAGCGMRTAARCSTARSYHTVHRLTGQLEIARRRPS